MTNHLKRNYFIVFTVGVAFAVSLTSINMAALNWVLYAVPTVIFTIAYLICIGINTLK